MADTNTPVLDLVKPEIGGSTDNWGEKLNSDLDIIDGLFDAGQKLKLAKGGTGASTAADARSNLGLGTIATQAADSVNIDGGAIDSTPIGGATPAAGAFTTLEADSADIAGGVVAGGAVAATGALSGASVTSDGQIESKATGFKFPDGTVQVTAATSSLAYQAKAVNFTAVFNSAYWLTGNNVVATLPGTPTDGMFVVLANGASITGCSVGRNGKTIMGLAEDLSLDNPNFAIKLVYRAATGDWRIAI